MTKVPVADTTIVISGQEVRTTSLDDTLSLGTTLVLASQHHPFDLTTIQLLA